MAAREFDPVRLDVAAFATEAAQLDGRWPLRDFARIVEGLHADARNACDECVAWGVRGERRTARGRPPQLWLHVKAATQLPLQCQRCLDVVWVPISIERSILFVPDAAAAEQLDADSEDDVLALTRALDLRELIEDELLLAHPLVPRHEVCPHPLLGSAQPKDAVPNAFAVLAELKRGSLPN